MLGYLMVTGFIFGGLSAIYLIMLDSASMNMPSAPTPRNIRLLIGFVLGALALWAFALVIYG